jgi:putative ABC transport system permease protein
MRWWELFRQAMAGAARARLRSALTALGVAIGCGALVSMIAFALGLQRQIELPLKRLGMLNDVHVSPRSEGGRDGDRRRDRNSDDEESPDAAADEGEGHDSNREQPNPAAGDAVANSAGNAERPKHPPLDAAAIEALRTIPGVKYAYPDMSLHDVDVAHDDKSARAFAMALPREIGQADQFTQMLAEGRFFSLDDVPEVVIAKSLVHDLGFKSPLDALYQTLDISTAGLAATDEQGQFEFQRKTLAVKIVGVFEPPNIGGFGPRSMGQAILMPIDLLQQLPGLVESQLWRMRRQGAGALDTYPSVTVRAENPGEVPRIAKEIKARGFEARTVLSQLEDMRVAFLYIESLLTAVGSVALIIAGLGIANTLLMTVLERYEEIGLYKAIGATDGDVRLMFIAEAAVLGLIGSLAGLVLAAVVCWGLQWGVNVYLAGQGVEREVDVFYFPLWLLAGAVSVATALSVLSGLYPASRAARVDPIKALRRA